MIFELMTHPHEDIHRKVRHMSGKGYDLILTQDGTQGRMADTGAVGWTLYSSLNSTAGLDPPRLTQK